MRCVPQALQQLLAHKQGYRTPELTRLPRKHKCAATLYSIIYALPLVTSFEQLLYVIHLLLPVKATLVAPNVSVLRPRSVV
jgi:hypothetical protein